MKWLPASIALVLIGCGHRTEQYILPDQITDFSTLFGSNCSGCHGRDGHSGAARPLHDPLFLALIGKEKLRDVIAKGVHGTAMQPFLQSAGGTLTDQQVTILADQMEARWSRPKDFVGVALPAYSAELGNATSGESVFQRDCSMCHGEHGIGGSIIDPAFLSLISDQSLRTAVLTGRADRGMPDFRSHTPGPAMTAQEIADVVAWLSSHRVHPGNLALMGCLRENFSTEVQGVPRGANAANTSVRATRSARTLRAASPLLATHGGSKDSPLGGTNLP